MWNFKVKSWPCSCPAGAATVEPVWGLGYVKRQKTDHSYNIRRRDRPLHHYSCCQHHSLLTLATTGGGVEIGDLVSTWMSWSLQWSLMENLGPSLAFPTTSMFLYPTTIIVWEEFVSKQNIYRSSLLWYLRSYQRSRKYPSSPSFCWSGIHAWKFHSFLKFDFNCFVLNLAPRKFN